MLNKKFSERLNSALDNIDVPTSSAERIDVLSKLLKIPKFKAESLLSGAMTPDVVLLNALAEEFEVSAAWLAGKEESSH